MNRADLIGNLTADPVLRTLESGRKVANFSVATNEPYRDREGEWQQRTEFHRVSVWGAGAERAAERLATGDQVQVCGRLSYSSNERDGVRYHNASIEVSSGRHWWKLLRKRGTANEGSEPDEAPADEAAA